MAGMVYARGLQQGSFGTETLRDRFRHISRQWHRFLGFGAEDGPRIVARAKRTRDVFNDMREEARL